MIVLKYRGILSLDCVMVFDGTILKHVMMFDGTNLTIISDVDQDIDVWFTLTKLIDVSSSTY